jgi:hypothetical protein
MGEQLSQHVLSLSSERLLVPPLGVGKGIFCLDVSYGSIDSGCAEAHPGPVEPPRTEQGVLALSQNQMVLEAGVLLV